MAVDVVFTDYGRPASGALAQAIVDAKDGNTLAPVTVIVPSNFAGLAARRMLGSGDLGVRGVANVNFMTPFRLAELLAVGELRGRKPLTKPVLGAAVRRALGENPRHFQKVRDHQATERALAAVVGELSNVSVQGLDAIEQAGGHSASIIELYRAIKAHLKGFHDEADVARAAAHRSDLAQVAAPFGHLIWYLPGPLAAPLANFLRTLLGVSTTTIVTALTGDSSIDAQVVRTLRIAGVTFADQVDDGAASQLPLADHIISVTDADEEVRAVIREIVQLVDSGVPLDRIGVFHPTPDPYVRILEQQLRAAEIAANGPSRRQLSETIAGRVLLAALVLPAERWRRDRVIALVNSGPLRHGNAPVRPAVWDNISRQAGVVSGLGDWRAKLEGESRRLESSREKAETLGHTQTIERLDRQHADVGQLQDFVESLSQGVAAIESARGWVGRSDAARELLQSLLDPSYRHGWWPEAEQVAFDLVESALERLAALEDIDPDPSMPVFVRALSSELAVARDRSGRFGNGVVYGPLSSAPGHDLEAVFVLGCTEGLCPSPRREDVLLPDRARRLTNGDLPERLGQIGEQQRLFLAAVSSAPQGHRWLFLPRGDLRSSRRSRPSRWLLPTASHLAGRALYATDFEHSSPPGVYEVASHAQALVSATHYASVEERDVAQVFSYVQAGGEASGHPAAQLVAQGLAMQSARRGAAFTEFDGNVGSVANHGAGADSMSASRFESWSECGFRYFLGYVLGLSERDDPERTIELSALDRGAALHDILERFMTQAIEHGAPEPDRAWSAQDRAQAQEIAAEVFDEYERRGRTGRPVEWHMQKSELLALVDEFLTADDTHRADAGATPMRFEMPFGMRGADPLVIQLDHDRTLRFKGMIDRVDQVGHGFAVSDYKTGNGKKYADLNGDDPTMQGTMLQLGLYAEAVAQMFDNRSLDTRYWMVNSDAGHARLGYAWTDAHRERLVQVLTTIADGIHAGVFAAVPGEWQSFRSTYQNCTYCDFDSVCPKGRAEQADEKADAPELSVRVALTTSAAVGADE